MTGGQLVLILVWILLAVAVGTMGRLVGTPLHGMGRRRAVVLATPGRDCAAHRRSCSIIGSCASGGPEVSWRLLRGLRGAAHESSAILQVMRGRLRNSFVTARKVATSGVGD